MLRINNLSKSFGKKKVLNNVSFSIDHHEIVCLMGKSGMGKTTILRCLNQLESMDSGTIVLDDLKLTPGMKKNPAFQKAVGLVFQNYNLFPHWTVLENCINAPVYHKLLTKEEAVKKAEALLEEMQILEEKNSYPGTLSGGQKQRAAIVRACMLDPKILCFDEPTSALDTESSQKVADMITALSKKEIGILIVTHDEGFAEKVSTTIIHLDEINLKH